VVGATVVVRLTLLDLEHLAGRGVRHDDADVGLVDHREVAGVVAALDVRAVLAEVAPLVVHVVREGQHLGEPLHVHLPVLADAVAILGVLLDEHVLVPDGDVDVEGDVDAVLDGDLASGQRPQPVSADSPTRDDADLAVHLDHLEQDADHLLEHVLLVDDLGGAREHDRHLAGVVVEAEVLVIGLHDLPDVLDGQQTVRVGQVEGRLLGDVVLVLVHVHLQVERGVEVLLAHRAVRRRGGGLGAELRVDAGVLLVVVRPAQVVQVAVVVDGGTGLDAVLAGRALVGEGVALAHEYSSKSLGIAVGV